jgi:hypothetical protein
MMRLWIDGSQYASLVASAGAMCLSLCRMACGLESVPMSFVNMVAATMIEAMQKLASCKASFLKSILSSPAPSSL